MARPPPLDNALARRKSKQEVEANAAAAEGPSSPLDTNNATTKEAWSPDEQQASPPPSGDDTGGSKKPKEMSERARRIQAPSLLPHACCAHAHGSRRFPVGLPWQERNAAAMAKKIEDAQAVREERRRRFSNGSIEGPGGRRGSRDEGQPDERAQRIHEKSEVRLVLQPRGDSSALWR